MPDHPVRVLLIEDNEDDFALVQARLAACGEGRYQLDWAATYEQGLEAIVRGQHDICLLDHYLNSGTGPDLLRKATEIGVTTPAIMLTGRDAASVDLEAMRAGAVDYLVKDQVDAGLLDRAIRYALEHARNREKLTQLLGQIEHSRDDMRAILNRLRIGSAMTDGEGRITFVSEVCQHLLGRSESKLIGLHWSELWPLAATDLERLMVTAEQPREQRKKLSARVDGPGERSHWVEIAVEDEPRDPSRKIFFLYDVTELHDLRRLLDEKAQFQELVGKSEPMRRVYQQIRDLAAVDATVLIDGETGTGKELVARAIHSSSGRGKSSFVAVNCAGLTESLLASQLFGHRRGAFTGAVEDQQGLIEAANGGTLFLDEIGDVSMPLQTSLLRVLQEREIVRVGDSRPRKIDVRVIAATNRDLNQEVEKGNFRLDLLYRIRVVRIQLPPLRERREDIPLLVGAFLQKFRATTGKGVQEVSSEAIRLLMDNDWRGNVRELQSAIEYALIHCKGPVVQAQDLPPELEAIPRAGAPVDRDTPEAERAQLLDALARSRGKRSAAARLLGVSRATFYRRLSEHRILAAEHARNGAEPAGREEPPPAVPGAAAGSD